MGCRVLRGRRRPPPDRSMLGTALRPMPKRPPQKPTAPDLTVRERVLLFCVASRTDWQKAGVPGETIIEMIEKGLVVDHALDWLALTASGCAVLISLASRPSKRGFPQANQVTLTKFCRCNNSSGDDFAHHVRLAGALKRFEVSFESFTDHRNRLRVECSRSYE